MNELVNYGVLGIILIVFAIWYAKKDKQHAEDRERVERLHRDEREEMRKATERQFDEMNKGSNNVTNALSRLNTLIETLKK